MLSEDCTFGDETYTSEAYRTAMGQGVQVEDFFAAHDSYQYFNMLGLGGITPRNAVIADIGCGAGSFLDHVSGLARKTIAVEPTPIYHESLSNRGYLVYPFTKDAIRKEAGNVYLATSFQVIEHVSNPVEFLQELSQLLSPDGKIVIATPNRKDILLKLLPEDFMPFYFRRAHRWYFEKSSLIFCAEKANLRMHSCRHIHTFGMSNTLAWLRDRKPTGNKQLEGINADMDQHWAAWLQSTEQADTIYITFEKNE